MERMPADLHKALIAAPKSKAKWEDLTPIARRDFISWILSAKQSETRKRRVEKTCDMLMAGKRRPCCYAIVPMNLYTALNANAKAKAEWSSLTPDERRDLVRWIDSDKSGTPNERIKKVCTALATGKRFN